MEDTNPGKTNEKWEEKKAGSKKMTANRTDPLMLVRDLDGHILRIGRSLHKNTYMQWCMQTPKMWDTKVVLLYIPIYSLIFQK